MKKGYTLLEILAVTILLAGFVVCFFEGVQMMSAATMSQQNRLEATMVAMGELSRWRVDPAYPSWSAAGYTVGAFGNGVGYTLSGRFDTTVMGLQTWKKYACTIQWREPVVGGASSRVLTTSQISVKQP